MIAVTLFVAGNPGCSKAQAARGGDASPDSVARVIRAGLVRETRQSGHSYRLYVTDTGSELIRRTS